MKRIFITFLVLTFISSFVLYSVQANADPAFFTLSVESSENVVPMDECYSLDVIFIIDQSGSMSGDAGSPPNDPIGNRFEAPRYAMDWLANNRLGRCVNAVHRISVISFGTTVEVNLPLTVINPSTQEEWESIKGGLESRIEEMRLGATDPLLAIEQAKEIIENSNPQGSIERKRVMILLTDGQPCVNRLGCVFGSDRMDHEAYMKDLSDYLNENFLFSEALLDRETAIKDAVERYGTYDDIPEELKNKILIETPITHNDLESSVYFWMVAMNANSNYLRSDGEVWKQLTTSRAGTIKELKNNAIEVPKIFNEVLSSLQGITPELLGCGNLAIDPYLAGAVLDVFKVADGLEVEIAHNGKSLVTGEGDLEYFGVEQYGQYGAIEHYRFAQPPAGLWTITASNCEGVEAQFIEFKPKVQYLQPESSIPSYNLEGALFDPNDPYSLSIKITDAVQAEPLNEDPNYPLDLKAIITAPDGSQTSLTMGFQEEGVWATTDPIPTSQLGTYGVQMLGEAICTFNPDKPNDCNNEPFEVVNDSTGFYTTVQTTPFRLEIVSPDPTKDNEVHGPPLKFEIQPLHVKVRVIDNSGQPLDQTAVFMGELESAIEATLSAGGQSKTIHLTPINSSTGEFYGIFHEPAETITQNLSIAVVGEYNRSKYQLQQNPISLEFTRSDPLFHQKRVYLGMAGLLALIMLGVIFKLVWDTTNVVVGSLEFTNGENTKTLSINKRRRVAKIKSGFPPDLGAKNIKICNNGELGGRRRISLVIDQTTGGKRTENLIDGNPPQPISSFWRVQYKWGGVVKGKSRKPKKTSVGRNPRYPTRR